MTIVRSLPPPFIAIEGIDGAGKSSFVRLLAAELNACGYPVMALQGALLLNLRAAEELLRTEQKATEHRSPVPYLNAWHGASYLRTLALQEGVAVICDRSWWTGIVRSGYQPTSRDDLRTAAAASAQPTLSVFLEVEPQTAMTRISARPTLGLHESDHELLRAALRYREFYENFRELSPSLRLRSPTRERMAAVARRIALSFSTPTVSEHAATWWAESVRDLALLSSAHVFLAASDSLVAVDAGQHDVSARQGGKDVFDFLRADPCNSTAVKTNPDAEKWADFHLRAAGVSKQTDCSTLRTAFSEAVRDAHRLWSILTRPGLLTDQRAEMIISTRILASQDIHASAARIFMDSSRFKPSPHLRCLVRWAGVICVIQQGAERLLRD